MKLASIFWFLFTSFIVIGQSYYFPNGKVSWIESYWQDNPDLLGFERTEGSNAYVLDRDTIIEGKLYRNLSFWKVNYHYYKFSFVIDTNYVNEKIADAGAMRATADGKIYYRHYGNLDLRSIIFANYSEHDTLPINTDVLFYDFNLIKGDTVYNPFNHNYYGVVDSVGSIEIAGRNRKVFWIACESIGNEVWIEGIGSLRGFFSPCVLTMAEYGGGFLSCYEEKGNGTIGIDGYIRNLPIILYQPNESCQSFLTAIKTVQYNNPEIKLYPIPATNWLRIEYDHNIKINSLQVANYLGQIIKAPVTSYSDGLLQLNVEHLPVGNYVIMLNTDQQILTTKFVKLGN